MIPKRVSRHGEIPGDIKEQKNDNLKIWSFLTQNRGLTPWQKVDFFTKNKYSFKSFQSSQKIRKRPLRHVLGFPRDQGQRYSPEKMESGERQKGKFFQFFARAFFTRQNDSLGSFTTRRHPWGHKGVKKEDFKIW